MSATTLWFPIWVYTKHFPIIQRTGSCLSCLLESKPWEIQSIDHSSCSQCAVWYAANPGSKALSSSLWNLLHLFHKVTLNLFNLLHHCLWHLHLMHWADNWRRRFIRQLPQLILRRPVLHFRKGSVSFYFIFRFIFFQFLPRWIMLPPEIFFVFIS